MLYSHWPSFNMLAPHWNAKYHHCQSSMAQALKKNHLKVQHWNREREKSWKPDRKQKERGQGLMKQSWQVGGKSIALVWMGGVGMQGSKGNSGKFSSMLCKKRKENLAQKGSRILDFRLVSHSFYIDFIIDIALFHRLFFPIILFPSTWLPCVNKSQRK